MEEIEGIRQEIVAMNERILIAIILAGIIIAGFINKLIELFRLNKRRDFTVQYHNNFVEFSDNIIKNGMVDQKRYQQLMLDTNAITDELGIDGVVSEYFDPMKRMKGRNLQLFLNYMDEVRTFMPLFGNVIASERYSQYAGLCQDALLRHGGKLDNDIKSIKKALWNPISCFSEGFKWLLGLPVDILMWLGIINPAKERQVKASSVFKIISGFVTIVGFFGSIVSIVVGWDQFIAWIKNIF